MQSAPAVLRTMGLRMRDRRLALDLSQGALGKRAGVSRDTVLRAERGENIGSEPLVRIAIALDALTEFGALFPKPETRSLDEIIAANKPTGRVRASRNVRA